MVELVQSIGSVEVVISALLATAVVIVHHVLARWWETAAGRHVFTFEAVLAACLDLWAIRLLFPDGDWFLIPRLVAFTGVPIVLAWRIQVLLSHRNAGRRKRTQSNEPTPEES
uniref:putative phage holin n=1 Tax=Herbidospora sakaeratensis TaxID=564415 RepID=UPI0007836397|nr:hypothetical protein [Herbidospora sakaeratensis]